jgi:hypothetical protein
MVLKEYMKSVNPDEVVYLGCKHPERQKFKANGSGFFFIGHARDAPLEEHGNVEVAETYPHYVDIPGTTILIDGIVHGNFWTWHEYDPNVPLNDQNYAVSDTAFENLMIALAKSSISEYRNEINKHVRELKPKSMEDMEDIFSKSREKCRVSLEFVSGSGMGEYLITAVEDEARVLFKNPKLLKLDYPKRYEIITKERRKLQTERVRKSAKSRYATIKGKSVNHNLV